VTCKKYSTSHLQWCIVQWWPVNRQNHDCEWFCRAGYICQLPHPKCQLFHVSHCITDSASHVHNNVYNLHKWNKAVPYRSVAETAEWFITLHWHTRNKHNKQTSPHAPCPSAAAAIWQILNLMTWSHNHWPSILTVSQSQLKPIMLPRYKHHYKLNK